MNYLVHPKVQIAAAQLAAGGVMAYPTEAVWGLGCDPFNGDAVARVLALKRRPVAKGLILVAATFEQLDFLLFDLGGAQQRMLKDSWPGPNTWLVPHRDRVPDWVCGQHATVGVRVSAHPLVRALCSAYGGPLVSTSANPQGLPPARWGFQARRYFGVTIGYLPGTVNHGAKPSVIRDLITGATLRE